jgi:L-iditol 2-dehydrogenase
LAEDFSGMNAIGPEALHAASNAGMGISTASIGTPSICTGRITHGAISVKRIGADSIKTERLSVDRIGAKPILSHAIIPISKTMRAAVYRGVNDVRVETVPVPLNALGSLDAGEVLVRIDTCGICGTDLKKIHTGSHGAPRIFGHEMAGTIAMVGVGVKGFAVGDRVMAYHHIPCGHCYYCRKQTFAQCETYKKVGCTAGFAPAGGGFAEYIRVMDWIVATGGLVKVPSDIPFEQAAFIEPVNTCYKAVRLLDLKADETVLVIGQGPIGILLAALAKRTGATVLTSDPYPERHAIAATFGLDRPLDARGDVVAAAQVATEGRGADVVLVAVGADALIPTAMAAVRPGGRVMLFASTQHGESPFDPAAVCMDEKTLMGSYSASVAINEEVAQLVFAGYRDGTFDLTRLISHRFALEDAVAAINLASHPQAGSMKIVIKPQMALV